jgi:hypothetical protein
LARGRPLFLPHNVLVYVGNILMRRVAVAPRYIHMLMMLPLRKPLRATSSRFPFGSLCSLATGMDLGSGPSKERYRGHYDHRPFSESIEELSPVLFISCGHFVRHTALDLIDFHEKTLLVEQFVMA